MRVVLMLVAACAITVAQESRPFGLLPRESPLAPIQEALLRGDSLEARAALDAFLVSASPDVLAGLAPQASLLRAASEPVPQRAEAMLGVAISFADRPVAEAACVAGLAALLSDGPEVGDLAEPLLARPAATGRPDPDPSVGAISAARRDRLLGGFLDVLERRVQALDRDGAAIDHARRLLAQFPSQASDWTWVRPSGRLSFPARLDESLRVRFHRIPVGDALPDPSRTILPEGPPALDLTFPADRDGLELPALEPGAWIVVATGSEGAYRRTWAVIVTDLELIAHSASGTRTALALQRGKPVPDARITRVLDPRRASRTRGTQPKEPENAVLSRAGEDLAIAPIVSQAAIVEPPPEPRLLADLWSPQPVYRASDTVRMRLLLRPMPGSAALPTGVVRLILWPRQPHEIVIEKTIAASIPIELSLPTATPPGPVRVHVLDAQAKTTGALPPEPILDAIPFTVQQRPLDPVQVLVSAPPSWAPGEPAPRVELLALFADGAPAADLHGSATVTAGGFSQELAFELDGQGTATVELSPDTIAAAALRRIPHFEVTARLLVAEREIARASRRIVVAAPPRMDGFAALRLELLTPDPAAGGEMRIAVAGPPGESILVSTASRAEAAPAHATLGVDGKAEVTITTRPEWWPEVEILASTRSLRTGRIEGRLCVSLFRPDTPSIAIEIPKEAVEAGAQAEIGIAIASKSPLDGATVSVAVVDDDLLRLSGAPSPDPASSLRRRETPLALRASSSVAPVDPSQWFASLLGRADRPIPPVLDPGMSPAAVSRGAARGPVGSAAQDVGGFDLESSVAFFEPSVTLDAGGRARVAFPTPDQAKTWRVIVTVVDAKGAGSVQSATLRTTRGRRLQPPGAAMRRSPWVTEARLPLGIPGPPDYVAASRPLTAVASPPKLDGAWNETAEILTYRFPDGITDSLVKPAWADDATADRLAGRLLSHVAGRRFDGPETRDWMAMASKLPAVLLEDLAALRALKTRDGYSATRGGPTAFEITPLVLHALSVMSEAGVDPSAFAVVPDTHDGFLRIARRALAESQGNPEVALEHEDFRNDSAFRTAVPPARQATLLVETVIGLLALDPGNVVTKTAVGLVVRQSRAMPPAVLALAGRALSRAGDREGAALVASRLAAASGAEDGISSLDSEISRAAFELDLARLLEAPKEDQERLARRVAAACAQEARPKTFDAGVAYSALSNLWGRVEIGRPLRRELPAATEAGIPIESDGPALVVARRIHAPAGKATPACGSIPVERKLFSLGTLRAPESAGTEIRFEDGPVSIRPGTLLRIELAAQLPADGLFEIRCRLPLGTRALAAPGASSAGRYRGDTDVVWRLDGPRAEPEVRLQAWAVAAGGARAWWDPCTVVRADTLETLGWSSSGEIDVSVDYPADAPHATVHALEPAALATARERLVKEIVEAGASSARIRELFDLPDGNVAISILSNLDSIVPLLGSAEVMGRLFEALGPRRGELWTSERLDLIAKNPRALRTLAEIARDAPEARALVARWLADAAALGPTEAALAPTIALTRMRASDPAEVPELWAPPAVHMLLASILDDRSPTAVERLEACRDLPFAQEFSRMFAGTRPVDEVQVRGWMHVLDFLEARVRAAEGRSGIELLGLVAAITERSRQEVALFTRLEVDFRLRQDELRVAAASRGLELLESGAIPIEAATLPLLTAVSPSEHVPRILRVLGVEMEAGRGDLALPLGAQLLDRHRDAFSLDDRAGSHAAMLAASGPRQWRLPAILSLRQLERRRLPITVLEPFLRSDETRSAAIDLLLDRDDSADLLLAALEQRLLRHEARLVMAKLEALAPRPFERIQPARLLVVLGQLDAEAARPVEEEIRRRAEENPAAVAQMLADSREERVRHSLVRILGKARFTEVPWDPADPGADRIRTFLLARAGDAEAGATVRAWMKEAAQAVQTSGRSDAALQELWPYLVGHATPLDVLEFGTPASLDALKARAAAWSDDEIAAFLRSPEARPDPTAAAGHWGAAPIVAQLIGPARAPRFADDLLALWRAYVDAGLAFDALSLFGQLGPIQVPAMLEVLGDGAGPGSRPARFTEAQKLAYIAALGREVGIQREVDALPRVGVSPEIAAALARYALEVTGYWTEPRTTSTRPASGPKTPQDWQRALITRLRNEGLGAISRAEPDVLHAWEKALRERGLAGTGR